MQKGEGKLNQQVFQNYLLCTRGRAEATARPWEQRHSYNRRWKGPPRSHDGHHRKWGRRRVPLLGKGVREGVTLHSEGPATPQVLCEQWCYWSDWRMRWTTATEEQRLRDEPPKGWGSRTPSEDTRSEEACRAQGYQCQEAQLVTATI